MVSQSFKIALFLAGLLSVGVSAIDVDAQLIVQIEASKNLKKNSQKNTKCHGLAEVVLSRGEQFLFHTSIPVGGNAEFKLLPGKYQIRALTQEHCVGSSEFDFKGEQMQVTAQLEPEQKSSSPNSKTKKRKPANFGYMGGGLAGGYGMGIMPQTYPAPSPTPWGVPWWYQYYNPWYSNFNSPCVWNPGFCMGPYYPAGGSIAMGKPNLYLRPGAAASGAATEMHVRLSETTFKGLMASSPAHLEKGWQVTISSEGVTHSGVTYPYLFYDLRTSESHLQLASGFCADKDPLLKRMDAALEARGYPANAMKDFRDYWSVHFPAGQRYCVLPQLEKEMNLSAPLQFSAPVNLVRTLFLVFPEFIKKTDPRMPAWLAPVDLGKLRPWSPEKKPLVAADIPVEKPTQVEVFEWGLAFLFAGSSASTSNSSGVSDISRGSSSPVSQ
jgi:hypothetical protein